MNKLDTTFKNNQNRKVYIFAIIFSKKQISVDLNYLTGDSIKII